MRRLPRRASVSPPERDLHAAVAPLAQMALAALGGKLVGVPAQQRGPHTVFRLHPAGPADEVSLEWASLDQGAKEGVSKAAAAVAAVAPAAGAPGAFVRAMDARAADAELNPEEASPCPPAAEPAAASVTVAVEEHSGEVLERPGVKGLAVGRAWYGGMEVKAWDLARGADVTEAVVALMSAGTPVRACNRLLGGDPLPGSRKVLLVDFVPALACAPAAAVPKAAFGAE